MDRIRLLLLVDYVLVRESLSRQLRLEPDFEIAAEYMARRPRAWRPSAVRLSMSCYWTTMLSAIRLPSSFSAARQAGYGGRFLVLASEKDTASLFLPLRAGASGVFRKHSSFDSLPKAIRHVAAGEAWVDLEVLQLLARPFVERESHTSTTC